jgi:hypothetical protein
MGGGTGRANSPSDACRNEPNALIDVYARSHCHTALIYARWDD